MNIFNVNFFGSIANLGKTHMNPSNTLKNLENLESEAKNKLSIDDKFKDLKNIL